jgi:phage shock protein PspC (stress-responsive transcriptional regulator)
MNRRLYRSRQDSVLGGVAGGVAEYLDVDPSIVRVIWAVLAIVTGGLFLVLYIVMWIVVPEGSPPPMPAAANVTPPAGGSAEGEPPGQADASAAPPTWSPDQAPAGRSGLGGAVIFGLILIGIGAWFLVDQYLPAFDRDLIWPIALIALGAALLVVSLTRRAQ